MTPDILQKILRHKRREVDQRRERAPLPEQQAAARDAPPPRGFAAALRRRTSQGRPAIIAEIKKASPSKGVLREHFDAAELAAAYQAGGACCVSVLTDAAFFQGGDGHLEQARRACDLPLLRKDFIIDPYQVYESRALNADCVLLIVAALADDQLTELAHLATDLGLEVLLETHNAAELQRALQLPSPLIGINNRDLRAFETKLQTTVALAPNIPPDRIAIAESGIHTAADIKHLRAHGVHAFLVGEALSTSPLPAQKLRELMG